MKTLLKVALPFVAIAAAIGVVQVLHANKPEVEKTEDKRQIAALNVAQAQAQSTKVLVRTQGEVRARTDIQLVPEVAGRIVKVNTVFAEGGSFTPDTILAQIDDANYRLAFIRAEARVAEAKVRLQQELADAAIKEKQWRDWVKDGEPTPLALNKPQVAQAQASLRAAEADLEDARLNLERTKIRLPFNGRVASREVGLGQFVAAGAMLGRVFATDVVEVRLPLTDRQMGELNLAVGFDADISGVDVPVTLSAEVGGRKHDWAARIVRTQASIDQATRLYYAIAEVENPYSEDRAAPLPVGLFVEAEIESANTFDTVVIPRSALRGSNKVYVVEDDKMFIRTVDVLSTNSETALLAGGIVDGANVVVSPVRTAVNGMQVSINTNLARKGVPAEKKRAQNSASSDASETASR